MKFEALSHEHKNQINNNEQETPSSMKNDEAFQHALATIKAISRNYDTGILLTHSSPQYIDSPQFCAETLSDIFRCAPFNEAENREQFFIWATEKEPYLRVLPLLAAIDHLSRGEKEPALQYLGRALALNQKNLHAQNLWLEVNNEGQRSQELSQKFCYLPFEQFESQTGDRSYVCCPAWLPVPIGNLSTQSPDEIWNSETAQDIRASIHDGSFRYCSRMHCPKLTAETLPDRTAVTQPHMQQAIELQQTRLPFGPKTVLMSHDRSCQLSCPSCRTETIMARADEAERMNVMAEASLLPLLKDARSVVITGSGDAFASKHYRWILKQLTPEAFPKLRVDLMTNGLLIKKEWDALELEGRVRVCFVSIDAAEPDTYRILRRGGELDDLLENLEFLGALRRDKRVDRVRIDFVVQEQNFQEMPKAAELMRHYGFDSIKFQMIRSWGTYSPQEFQRHNIGASNHPRFPELLEVLKDSRLSGDDVQFSGFYSTEAHRLRETKAQTAS